MTAYLATFQKDPNDVLDYTVNWASWLGADTIVSSTFTVGTGLVVDSSSNTTTTTTVFISSGAIGQQYPVTNQIVTSGGRTVQRSFQIVVLAL